MSLHPEAKHGNEKSCREVEEMPDKLPGYTPVRGMLCCVEGGEYVHRVDAEKKIVELESQLIEAQANIEVKAERAVDALLETFYWRDVYLGSRMDRAEITVSDKGEYRKELIEKFIEAMSKGE